MPYPRSRSYATPEETFGITQKPLNDWFDAAASGMTRTGMPFSQSFEDADLRNQQRELEQERLRRQLESEQAAAEFLQNAAGAKPNALMRMIAEDPAILGSQDAPMIREYVDMQRERQEQRRAQQPLSNRTLGPAIAKSITDPVQRMKFEQRLANGEEAASAYESVQNEVKTQAQQAERRRMALDALKAGAIMESDFDSIINDPDAERRLAAAMGSVASRGKAGRLSDGEYSLKELIDIRKSTVDDLGDVIDPELKAWADEQIKFKTTGKPPAAITLPSTGAATDKAKTDTTETKQPAVPTLPPALPASDKEEADLKAQQQRGVTQEQQRQLADASWTGLKGTAAARGAEAGTPPDVISEARKAIVGGETTSKRAQRIAALARAYADGRDVLTSQTRTMGGNIMGGTEEGVSVPPEFVLLEELGYEPDTIVGRAPSAPGRPPRDVTALEAARAILADTATPFLELKKGAKQAEQAAARMTPQVQSSYEKLKATAQGLTPPQQ